MASIGRAGELPKKGDPGIPIRPKSLTTYGVSRQMMEEADNPHNHRKAKKRYVAPKGHHKEYYVNQMEMQESQRRIGEGLREE